jgi:hypothetical protein
MKQKPRLRLQFVGARPRILVAEPYYTPLLVVQTAAGALGAFASIIGGMAAIVGNGVIVPLLSMAVVCLLVFIAGELTLVRTDSVSGRFSTLIPIAPNCSVESVVTPTSHRESPPKTDSG